MTLRLINVIGDNGKITGNRNYSEASEVAGGGNSLQTLTASGNNNIVANNKDYVNRLEGEAGATIGIRIDTGDDNIVANNIILGYYQYSMQIYSDKNTITGNNIGSNGYGINILAGATNNTVVSNTMTVPSTPFLDNGTSTFKETATDSDPLNNT